MDLLGQLFRIPTSGRPISIIDLSGVPSEVVDVVVAALCRTMFRFALWNPERRRSPLLLVCEEAHRYAPHSESAAFGPTRDALSSIAKEGRKYGVSLGLVSQRPSELSESILSQCGTLVALRIANEADQQFIRRTLPDNLQSLASALPSLQTGEALIVGEGVEVPCRVRFSGLPREQRPDSEDVSFSEAWMDSSLTRSLVETATQKWRLQERSRHGGGEEVVEEDGSRS